MTGKTDRELLELAAKAAGLSIDKSKGNGGPIPNTGFDITGNAVLDWHNGKTWNPLNDDSDALRLAVKIELDLSLGMGGCEAGSVRGTEKVSEFTKKDPYTATRRAIVRAASAIGEKML